MEHRRRTTGTGTQRIINSTVKKYYFTLVVLHGVHVMITLWVAHVPIPGSRWPQFYCSSYLRDPIFAFARTAGYPGLGDSCGTTQARLLKTGARGPRYRFVRGAGVLAGAQGA